MHPEKQGPRRLVRTKSHGHGRRYPFHIRRLRLLKPRRSAHYRRITSPSDSATCTQHTRHLTRTPPNHGRDARQRVVTRSPGELAVIFVIYLFFGFLLAPLSYVRGGTPPLPTEERFVLVESVGFLWLPFRFLWCPWVSSLSLVLSLFVNLF